MTFPKPVDVFSRCAWAGSDPLYMAYHDKEWGVPVHEDRRLFEFLVLEGAQAGLSWLTVLRKREDYRTAFDRFDPEKVAGYDSEKTDRLLLNPGIIRNRLKITSAVQNAKAFLRVQAQFGSFDAYIWRFVDGAPVVHAWKTVQEIPASNTISAAMSRDLSQRGFKFVGPVICYAYMQAVGMVNDHTTGCFRYRELVTS